MVAFSENFMFEKQKLVALISFVNMSLIYPDELC